ncbi:glycosyltransferase [Mycobacterium sp.]|uniref:glycosyltransferase n=1 Tax=Mycobacterium sp. TaxID=1785 RepID=UPI0025ED44F6|nr:glycosyltransferase [Mycobacterium sp.]MBW0015710.1 glycosyltransferase [Mycobacterium sp.]
MKVVVVCHGSRGDVEPGIAAGRELLRRGHDVLVAAPSNMLGFVEAAGLTAVAYGPDSREEMNPASELFRDLTTKMHGEVTMLTKVVEHVTQVKADKTATLKAVARGADLLLAGFNEQGLVANMAEYQRIPMAALQPFPTRILSSQSMVPVVTKQTDDAQRHALGLSEAPGSAAAEPLEIQAYDALCLPGPPADWVDPGGRRPFVGALTLELATDSDDEVLSWIADGNPPIYFGFGSTPIPSPAETAAVISAACARLGERALICAGPNDFTQMPNLDNVKVVGSVNHAAIFPACRAAVHHGGAGTTAAALRAGIPALILWFWLDQPVWAAGIERLKVGSGRAFSASTLDSLVADLCSVLTPECRVRAGEVAAQMSKPADSAAGVADLLEEMVLTGG